MKFDFRILTLSLTIGTLVFTASCEHEPDIVGATPPVIENNCNPDSVYFETEVLPLLVSSCGISGCHDAGTAEEGVVIRDYASIMREVKAGNPSDSELFEVITKSNPEKRMPPAPRQALSQAHIDKIEKWINQGAQNNVCADDNCDTLNVSFSGHIFPVVQNYCQGCHSGSNPSGSLSLTSYSEIANAAANGSLISSLKGIDGYTLMPKDSQKLSDCKIRQFELWIEAGTPEN